MKFEIIYDRDMPGCYSAGMLWEGDGEKAVFASEKEGDGPIISLELETLQTDMLSAQPGGCMNVVPLPGEEGSFLAIQKFYPVFRSEEAVIVWGWKTEDGYSCKEVQTLPFVHRIEIIHIDTSDFLIAASLCGGKRYTDDWESPGSIYIGRIDYKNRSVIEFKEICGGIYKNHGLTKIRESDQNGLLISAQCGVFLLTPPKEDKGEWIRTMVIDSPSSDAAVADIDGDGQYEMGVISPFHGGTFQIYKKIGNSWKIVYELPGKHAFGHAIWGGNLDGKECFLVGFRDKGMELYVITMEDEVYRADLVDTGAGPSNVTVVHGNRADYICAANRQSDRCTVYRREGRHNKV